MARYALFGAAQQGTIIAPASGRDKKGSFFLMIFYKKGASLQISICAESAINPDYARATFGVRRAKIAKISNFCAVKMRTPRAAKKTARRRFHILQTSAS